MKIRSQVGAEVQTQLRKGMRKEQIYTELKEKYPAASVERSLAQWPDPAAKAKNRFLNVPLLIILVVFTLVKILQLSGAFPSLELSQQAAALLSLAIHFYMIYGVLNCNLIGYLLVVLMSLSTLLSIRVIGAGTALPIALSAAAIALAWFQKSRLFPNTSWILRHKKDRSGKIIF
jgi:hypothetical protein